MQRSHLRPKAGIALSILLCASLFTTETRPVEGWGFGCKGVHYDSKEVIASLTESAVFLFLFFSYIRLETKDKKTAMTFEEVWQEVTKAGIKDIPGLALEAMDDVWVGIKQQNPYMYVAGSKIVIPKDERLVREAWENNQLMQNY